MDKNSSNNRINRVNVTNNNDNINISKNNIDKNNIISDDDIKNTYNKFSNILENLLSSIYSVYY